MYEALTNFIYNILNFKRNKVKRELKNIQKEIDTLYLIKVYKTLILNLPNNQIEFKVGEFEFVLEKDDKLKPTVDKILIEEINKQIENLKGKL